MAEFIERDKAVKTAISACVDICNEIVGHGITQFHAVKITDKIENIPAADVVEVVRCKECRYYEIHKPNITLNCERDGRLIPMNPDGFCSHGERKCEDG
jgi:hypothetical protein